MYRINPNNVYLLDFETTSEPNLYKDGYVRVWLYSLVNIETKESYYGYTIEDFLNLLFSLKLKIVYFHNLKFDGHFLLHYFLTHGLFFELLLPNNIWYSMKFMGIEFRDSLKKFNGTVKDMAKMLNYAPKLSLDNETGKLIWDYYIPDDYKPCEKDIQYCVRDSEIVLEFIKREWDNKRFALTLSGQLWRDVSKSVTNFKGMFPVLNIEDYKKLVKSYRGGVCLVNPIYLNEDIEDVYGYDVHGMYSWVQSECRLPVGLPYYDDKKSKNDLSIIHFRCEFLVKNNMFPFLQIKRNFQYYNRDTEYLLYSDGMTELTMTDIDYELFKKHYHIYNEELIEIQSYKSKILPIGSWIQENIKWKTYYSQKETYDKYFRNLYKLNNNSVYGSFALSIIDDKVYPYLEDNVTKLMHIKGEKEGRYIPYLTFVTLHLRKKTIDLIQLNYENWIYSDTDSMYLTKPLKNIEVHEYKSGLWGYETYGDFVDDWNGEPFPHGKFLRLKTYCLLDEDYNIYKKFDKDGLVLSELRCLGMPLRVKELVNWDNFYLGLKFEGKKLNMVVPGGVCLKTVPFSIT